MKAYRLLDPKTHQTFVEKDVHYEESSPSLSSNRLHTSYSVDTDSDTSNSASIDSNTWGSIDNSSERSLYQLNLHAYITTMIGPIEQGTSSLPGPTSVIDLEDSIDDLPLLLSLAVPSSVVTRAPYDPLVHSLHDQLL